MVVFGLWCLFFGGVWVMCDVFDVVLFGCVVYVSVCGCVCV